MATLEDGIPGAVAVELVHRYGAIVTNLAGAVMDVADCAPPGVAEVLREAVRDTRFQLMALVDGIEQAAVDDA